MMIVLVLFLCVSDPSVGLSTFLAVVVGVGDALAQSGLFAFAATTDPLYTSAVMAGNGTAGLIVGLLRLLTKWGFVNTDDALYKSSRVYFAVCVLVIAAAIFALYTVTTKNVPLSSNHVSNRSVINGDSQRLRDDDEEENDGDEENNNDNNTVQPFDAILPSKNKFTTTTTTTLSCIETIVLASNRVRRVTSEAITYLAAIFGVFLITLSLFPAIMVEIKSSSKNLGDWWSVILIVIFNLFDTIGRASLSLNFVRSRLILFLKGFDRKLLLIVFLRALYIPLFWLSVHPDVLAHDGFVILVVATFALTNGVLSTYIMSVGSNSFQDDQDKETVSNLIVLSLMLGLAVGSVLGVGIEALIWV